MAHTIIFHFRASSEEPQKITLLLRGGKKEAWVLEKLTPPTLEISRIRKGAKITRTYEIREWRKPQHAKHARVCRATWLQ
jgi:hypothetical protein